ncbi:hypothetical protein [Amycolatopsis minnesotensis]|uniref:Uncharacterized protein n=1 Tax=Amycolatopsis minnesotensis TaxID=337894 RepID=A0ABN2QQH0_9PSEU
MTSFRTRSAAVALAAAAALLTAGGVAGATTAGAEGIVRHGPYPAKPECESLRKAYPLSPQPCYSTGGQWYFDQYLF